MVDILSSDKRSEFMSRIRGSDTGPELAIRSMLHRKGYRFRLHRKDLPGKPDIVLPRFKTVIFVHGCFWHRHANCRHAYTPKTKVNFWLKKFDSNIKRDKVVRSELVKMGWNVVTIWECETRFPARLWDKLEVAIRGNC